MNSMRARFWSAGRSVPYGWPPLPLPFSSVSNRKPMRLAVEPREMNPTRSQS